MIFLRSAPPSRSVAHLMVAPVCFALRSQPVPLSGNGDLRGNAHRRHGRKSRRQEMNQKRGAVPPEGGQPLFGFYPSFSLRMRTTSSPARRWPSTAEAPRWGMGVTFGWSMSEKSSGGSLS